MVIVSRYIIEYDIEILEGYIIIDGETRYVNIVHDIIDDRYNARYSDLSKETQGNVIEIIKRKEFMQSTCVEDKEIYLDSINKFKAIKCKPRFNSELI